MTTTTTRSTTEPAKQVDAISEEADAYPFERLTLPLILADMRYRRTDPSVGDSIPAFDLPTTDGGWFSSDDLGERPVLLVFGSLTCPLTEAAGPGINELHGEFGDRVRFVAVNVREAHPGERLPQPQTDEDKMMQARALREHHGFDFEVAADDIHGTLHRSVGPKPNSAYLIDRKGTIEFRAHWATDTRALEGALNAIVSNQPLARGTVSRTLPNVLKSVGFIDDVMERAGSQAKRDLWRGAPPMAAMMTITRLFPGLSPAKRGRAAIGTLALGVMLAAVGLMIAL